MTSMASSEISSTEPLKRTGNGDGLGNDPSATELCNSHSTNEDGASAQHHQAQESVGATVMSGVANAAAREQRYENGYHFPPKYSVKENMMQWMKDFCGRIGWGAEDMEHRNYLVGLLFAPRSCLDRIGYI